MAAVLQALMPLRTVAAAVLLKRVRAAVLRVQALATANSSTIQTRSILHATMVHGYLE